MVFFLVTRSGRHVLDKYLASWGGPFLDDVAVLTYSGLDANAAHPPGTYVFADLERMTDAEHEAAARLWARLDAAGDGYHLLNHPERSLGRFELLRVLHAEGRNSYSAVRARDWAGEARFPVFLRSERDHAGPRTRLLWDAAEVDSALRTLRERGLDLDSWLVVEFEDCADDAGYYRKFSYFILDGVLMPRHVFFSRAWIQKLADLRGGAWAEEELAYLRDDPHARQLRPIFERAGIQYGRIDYSIGKDGIQVWEINTNPIILDPFDREDAGRVEVHEAFAASWNRALAELSAATPSPRPARWSAARLGGRAHVAAEAFKETPPGRQLRRLKHRLFGDPNARALLVD